MVLLTRCRICNQLLVKQTGDDEGEYQQGQHASLEGCVRALGEALRQIEEDQS